MNKYIILCPNNHIYKITAKSEQQIKNILDPILQQIIDEGYWEKGDSTNFIHEWEFQINGIEFFASNFIYCDWYQSKVWFEYKIITINEWYIRDEVKLFEEDDENNAGIQYTRCRWSED